jgi:hypothetical protein
MQAIKIDGKVPVGLFDQARIVRISKQIFSDFLFPGAKEQIRIVPDSERIKRIFPHNFDTK